MRSKASDREKGPQTSSWACLVCSPQVQTNHLNGDLWPEQGQVAFQKSRAGLAQPALDCGTPLQGPQPLFVKDPHSEQVKVDHSFIYLLSISSKKAVSSKESRKESSLFFAVLDS